MCGIVGVAGDVTRDEAARLVERMSATIVHRGPDEDGAWAGERFAFATRRLSIIDLPGGHQPMWTADGAAGIAFNGEIYNYRALRAELEGEGARFTTASDTEVLLELLHRHGLDALDRVEGMFALCLYEPAEQRLHLVRDRLGKKPLYWRWDGRRLLFGSELKALLAGLGATPEIDRQALHDYLTLRYVPGPETIWRGVSKLAPAHRLTLDLAAGTVDVRRWWHVDVVAGDEDPGRDAVAELAGHLLPAVEKRLLASDVPVGVLLSGGLDSSAIAAAAVELGHRAFHTFSVAFAEGGRFDERPYARAVADRVSARHHEVVIDREAFVRMLPDVVEYADEPIADLASVPLLAVSRLAAEHVKVVLSGEGSDEMLAGYDMDAMAANLERLRRLDVAPGPLLALASRAVPGRRGAVIGALAHAGYAGVLAERAAHMTSVFDEDEKSRLWRGASPERPTTALIRSWYAAAPSRDPLDQLQQVLAGSWLAEDLLAKADRMSMAASLELRVPFLDHALVEWAATLPRSWKVGDRRSGWTSKRVLREFAAERLPDEVLTRPKQGFPVPAGEWLRGELGAWAEDRLQRDPGALGELLDTAPLSEPLAAARRGDGGAAERVWCMLVLREWAERWL